MNTLFLSPNVNMIKGQILTNGIHQNAILNALSAVDRSEFVPQSLKHVAYVDNDIELCAHRYLLEPLVFAKLLAYLDVETSHTVLDIGTGLGYGAAVLSHLSHYVVAIEHSPELVALARKKLSGKDVANVDVITAPLLNGCTSHQPYDRIIIEGGVKHIPKSLEDQLAEGGMIVAIKLSSVGFATNKMLGRFIVGEKYNNVVSYVEKETVSAYPLQSIEDNSFSF
jgi:protein-L-isoaspartate(D-aspartate) O-methyltransferase